jgi:hypothetical protein
MVNPDWFVQAKSVTTADVQSRKTSRTQKRSVLAARREDRPLADSDHGPRIFVGRSDLGASKGLLATYPTY